MGAGHRIRMTAAWSGAMLLAVGVLFVLSLLTFGYRAFRMPSGGMMPTLLIGDYFYGKRIGDPAAVRQGDVVVFRYPADPRVKYVKRCVAVAGDTVAVRDGVLLVNGRAYESNFADRDGPHDCVPGRGDPCPEPRAMHDPRQADRNPVGRRWPPSGAGAPDPYVVPAGTVFVMGDNRDNSMDSRYFGAVPLDLVTHRATFIYWSWDAARSRPRLGRVGDAVR